MVHKLKCIQPYFDDVRLGRKTFEVRKDDRNYQVGDRLDIFVGSEDIVDDGKYRPHVHLWVNYKLSGGNFGIEEGYCVLGLTFIEPEKGNIH